MKQRDRKFRAYFEELDELVYPDENGYFIPNDSIDTFLMDGLGKPINLNDLSEHDGIIFEEWTGLKDKNEVDIYENDVAETKYQYKAQVIWHNEFACFCYKTINKEIEGEYQFYSKTEDIEVVGNIHEHKHLLK